MAVARALCDPKLWMVHACLALLGGSFQVRRYLHFKLLPLSSTIHAEDMQPCPPGVAFMLMVKGYHDEAHVRLILRDGMQRVKLVGSCRRQL